MRYGKSLAVMAALVLAVPGGAADSPVSAAKAAGSQADAAAPSAVEQRSVTQHTGRIAGRNLKYTAVAGTLTLQDDDGKPTASMFYVAYLLGSGDSRRPVTFFYNGGPGSSSLWLHMASFAPRRVVLNAPYASANPPHVLIDNDDSLLPYSDVIFLDAINTGYSRPLGDSKPETFLSADADIDIFARGVERFLTVHNRWNSPKYLFGESYGTSRSAGLVDRLQRDGAQMNGIIQVGTILDIGRALRRGDQDKIAAFPTMAMTAAYHGKASKPTDQNAFVQELRYWSVGPYAQALAKGNLLGQAEKEAIARQMASYTGISEAFFLERDLRVSVGEFQSELLRDQHKAVGELDGRFTAPVGTPDAAGDFDPSWSFVFRPMLSVWNSYVRNDLKFDTGLQYRRAFAPTFSKFDFRRKNSSAYGYYGKDLAQAMTENPNLQVYSLNGLYDFSTVFFGADQDYRDLRIPAELVSNIHYFYYGAGHMTYLDDTARRAMLRDIAPLYNGSPEPR
jgi:Carboxypeptidase C (cathepsin A)